MYRSLHTAFRVVCVTSCLLLSSCSHVGNGYVGLERSTLLDLRFRNIVKQEEDYSCGAAAMATLLTYHHGDVTSESDVLTVLQTVLDRRALAQRQMNGYSLLDLKRVAERKGYRAAGYRLTFEQLEQLSAPVIVHVEPLGYQHFAVLRDIADDRVFLADPSRGNLRMSTRRFLDEWDGVVFVLGKEAGFDQYRRALAIDPTRDALPDKLRLYRYLDRIERLRPPRDPS